MSTELNSPPGGMLWPNAPAPQQTMEPSRFTPQLEANPVLTESNSHDKGFPVASAVAEGKGI